VFESLSVFPFSFWVVLALLIGGGVVAWAHLRDGGGLPMMALLSTTAFWYVGDAYYNDYANNHAKLFEPQVLQGAWWEVAWFLVVYLMATPIVHAWINARYLRHGSGVLKMLNHGTGQAAFQEQLQQLFHLCALIWLGVIVLAVLRVRGNILYFFFPFWGYKAEPWGRGTLGSGFDALLTVVFYMQMLVTSVFGVVAGLATDKRIRSVATLCCLVSWPYFIMDRTRNSMLAIVVPGLLSWVFLRLRGSLLKKILVLTILFAIVDGWMKFVIANRSEMTITAAFKEKGFDLGNNQKTKHEGLNMYEELCWISTFFNNGSYGPNWGLRYFQDLVNPVPRVLWPSKPMIGFDYAVLRGQVVGGEDGVITATISTGLIGQGVVNFGRFLGPIAAALIMSFWAAIVARLDLNLHRFGRLPLYATGLFVTFNVGRDFCFLALYPFVFGFILIWVLDRYFIRQQSKVVGMRRQARLQPLSGTGAAPAPMLARQGIRLPPKSRLLFPRRKGGCVHLPPPAR
jgi:hypothetical protein